MAGNGKLPGARQAKTTNKAQYERLYELMSERADLAQGYTKLPKEEVQNFWEKVKGELNSLGPPLKDASIWRKVWFDWKSYIKRKLVDNKKETKSTGGREYRQHFFSKLEEAVIELTGLKTSTAGIKNTINVGPSTHIITPGKAESTNDIDVFREPSKRLSNLRKKWTVPYQLRNHFQHQVDIHLLPRILGQLRADKSGILKKRKPQGHTPVSIDPKHT
ncbi:uncharacterized protein LOC129951899 [Eupeodes corollae]|uniref:uncharacterized protein LOC129951899 n=1 Tax=Eupeodes corollae TaxID=290404 RepID=UPI002491C21A|nr:uncharacterized protein LOC129951899 [Eupeodes corollae]